MSPTRRREGVILAVAGLLAVALPLTAHHYLQLRIRGGLEPALERRLGVDVRIGGVDASLLGVVRLTDVRIGNVFAAGAVEAAVGIGPLMSGELYLDEIRVDKPRLWVTRTPSGETNVQQLIAHMRRRRTHGQSTSATRSAARSRIGRAVMTGGELVVDLGDRGQVRARDVELVGRPGGIRVITGAVTVSARHRLGAVQATFTRAATDISLGSLSAKRVLAVGGVVAVTTPNGHVVTLHDAALSRHVITNASPISLRGTIKHRHGASQLDIGASLVAPIRLSIRGNELPLQALTGLDRPELDLTRAFARGTAEVTLLPSRRVRVVLAADITGLHTSDQRVASVPVDIDGRVELNAELAMLGQARTLTVQHLALTRNGTELRFGGELVWHDDRLPTQANVTAHVPMVSCQNALTALPLAMRDRLAGMTATGTMGARMSLRFDRARDTTKLDVDVNVDRCRVTQEPRYADARRLKRRYRYTLPDGRRLQLGRGIKGYTRLKSLPRHVLRAFISGEDGRFYDHHGFDPLQIERSLALDLRDARFVRGGSTISQQLVKNLFLTHRRTLARKFQEAVLTWRLEKHLSKRQILERYLNIIELGQGIYGINAAAQHWFDKPVRKLRLREAAFLAALTPAPTSISRRLRLAGGMDKAMRGRVNVILRAMRRDRAISRADYLEARDQRLKLHAPKLARSR